VNLPIGQTNRRDWFWRGWRVRYTFTGIPAADSVRRDRLPIVCVHGFGAAIGHWRRNLAAWSDRYDCYALDLPGFGASSKDFAPYTIALWAEAVGDFLREVVGRPAIVVGHSIGSLVSLTAADRDPDWVRGVVCVTLPDPSLRVKAIPPPFRRAIATIEGAVGQRWLLRPLLNWLKRPQRLQPFVKLAYADAAAVTPDLVSVFADPAGDRDAVRALAALVRQASQPDYCPDIPAMLRRSRLPILLVWGRDDRLVPPKVARPDAFAQYSDRLALREIAPAGHCPHDECPEVFDALVTEWIETEGLAASSH